MGKIEGPPLSVKVWGPWACFTRPETKVERVSYPLMTPSAARGILEAIYWHPHMHWQVLAIKILKPIQFFSITRNEISSTQNLRAAQNPVPLLVEKDHTQRHSLILRDVGYVLEAHPVAHGNEHPAKFRDQFRRRVHKGRCFHRPYLGCREFAADFAPPSPEDQPLELDMDLGMMLFDIAYHQDPNCAPNGPIFFEAKVTKGILRVPQELYRQIWPEEAVICG